VTNLDFLNNEDDDDGMYSRLNERSELERFRNQYSEEELEEFVSEFRGVWEPWFRRNMGRDVPRHPWKVLKKARREWAEEENDGEWPPMEMRHALRVVKDEYVEEWRNLAYS